MKEDRRAKWRRTHRQQTNDRQNEKNFRWRAHNAPAVFEEAAAIGSPLYLASADQLEHTRIFFMATDGTIRYDDTHSAQQLIKDFLAAEKRRRKKGAPTCPNRSARKPTQSAKKRPTKSSKATSPTRSPAKTKTK